MTIPSGWAITDTQHQNYYPLPSSSPYALHLGTAIDPQDQVPFEKYAKAAQSLLKPSSAARAVASGAPFIERVDLLVKLISHQLGLPNAEIGTLLGLGVPAVKSRLHRARLMMRDALAPHFEEMTA